MDLFWEVFISRSTKIVAHGSGFARIDSKQEVLKPNQWDCWQEDPIHSNFLDPIPGTSTV